MQAKAGARQFSQQQATAVGQFLVVAREPRRSPVYVQDIWSNLRRRVLRGDRSREQEQRGETGNGESEWTQGDSLYQWPRIDHPSRP